MDQNAVIYPRGATQHSGDAVVKTPSRDPGDPEIAYGAEPTLVLPEKAKCSSTPERSRHVIPFAFLEVGFIGRIIWVGFALDLNVPLNGLAPGSHKSPFVGFTFSVDYSP